MYKHRTIRIICQGTKITGMTILDIPVRSEFNRRRVISAITNNKPEEIEVVWDSITKIIIEEKKSKFKWDGTWEDGKNRSNETGDDQYLLRMCLYCKNRAGKHISEECPSP